MTVEPAHKDTLSMAQRWLELSFVAALGLLFGFFVRHQTANTGFFTEKFGIVEMVCLYSPIILAAAAPLIRAHSLDIEIQPARSRPPAVCSQR